VRVEFGAIEVEDLQTLSVARVWDEVRANLG
jgi:hypothetical protein